MSKNKKSKTSVTYPTKGGFAPLKVVLTKSSLHGRKNNRHGMALGGTLGAVLGLLCISLIALIEPGTLTVASAILLSAGFTTCGLLFGTHFDLNRYFSLKMREKKALCFKNVLSVSKQQKKPVKTAKQQAEKQEDINSAITTVVYDSTDHHTQADTFRRDRVLSSARQALLSMDHTKQIRH